MELTSSANVFRKFRMELSKQECIDDELKYGDEASF